MANKPLGQHYIIKSAVITSDRDLGSEALNNIDVGNTIVELKIYETANRPYMLGEVLIVDQSDMIRALNIKGSERITITLSPGYNNGVDDVTKTFLIRGVKLVQNNDTFLLDLIEEIGYTATTKVFSKSYTGKLEDIISSICKGQLGRELKLLNGSLDTMRAPTHVVIPYWNTKQALEWLLDRNTTSTGSPYFITSSLYNDSLVLFNLESSLLAEPFNKDNEFIKSPTYTQMTESAELLSTSLAETAIISHLEKYTDSMHTLAMSGAVGLSYSLIDLNNNNMTQFNHSGYSTLGMMKDNQIIPNQDVYDPHMKLGDNYEISQPAASIHQVCSSNTYLPAQSYADDRTKSETINKLNNKILKNIMIQKTITATMPGKLYAAYKACVGQRVRMLFASGERLSNDNLMTYDKKLTGDYVLTTIIHTFSQTEYNVTIDGVKMTRDEL